jgi:hypothetical protein
VNFLKKESDLNNNEKKNFKNFPIFLLEEKKLLKKMFICKYIDEKGMFGGMV